VIVEKRDPWPLAPGRALWRVEFVYRGNPTHGLWVWSAERRRAWEEEYERRLEGFTAQLAGDSELSTEGHG
jgi:hypothetical protein